MRTATSILVIVMAITYAAEGKQYPPELVSARVTQAPTLDGKGEDEVWKVSMPLEVIAERPLPPNEGASVPVTIQSVHTDTDVYFLVSWEDSTESVSHKTWVWNAEGGVYEQGDDREDMLALALFSQTFSNSAFRRFLSTLTKSVSAPGSSDDIISTTVTFVPSVA